MVGSILRVLALCGFVCEVGFRGVLGLEMLVVGHHTPLAGGHSPASGKKEAQVCIWEDVLLSGNVPWWLPIIYMLQGTLSLPFLVHSRCFNLHFQSPYSGSKWADSAGRKVEKEVDASLSARARNSQVYTECR